jgi:predicted PurR-regulated permease PerM
MLGFNSRAASYTAAVVLLMLPLVYLVRFTLFVFTLAILFAYLLSPLVALAALLAIQVGSEAVDQANALAKKFPDMLGSWQQPTPATPRVINSVKEDGAEHAKFGLGDLDFIAYPGFRNIIR